MQKHISDVGQLPRQRTAKDDQIQQQIRNSLFAAQKQPITVRTYCEICRLATTAHDEYLYTEYKKYLSLQVRKPQKHNYNNIAGLLVKPNISYSIPLKVEQKKAEPMVDAGKRVVGMIAYAWDHYLRLIKGKTEMVKKKKEQRTSKEAGVYDLKNIQMALRRIEDMLADLEENKYSWWYYTKEGLATRQQEKKEIEEEETFIKLLQNMLEEQIKKVKDKRQLPEESQAIEDEQQSQNLSEASVDLGLPEERNVGRKSILEVLKIDYFKNNQGSHEEKPVLDSIAKIQQQRKFNAMALKYHPTAEGL